MSLDPLPAVLSALLSGFPGPQSPVSYADNLVVPVSETFATMPGISDNPSESMPPQYPHIPAETLTTPRHEDGGPFVPAGFTRSNSGRLPPAYDASWGDSNNNGRAVRLRADAMSIPTEDFVGGSRGGGGNPHVIMTRTGVVRARAEKVVQ